MNTPLLRFDGFDGIWSTNQFSEIARFNQGLQVSVENQFNTKDKNRVRFIRIVDVTQRDEDYRYISNVSGNFHVEYNDLFMVRYGASAGTVARQLEGIIANNLFKINFVEEVNSSFFYFYLTSDKVQKRIKNLNSSSAMPALTFSDMETLFLHVPSIKEQNKIGDFLNLLKNRIEKQQEKIEALSEYKKGMMQKLFSQSLRFKDENGKGFPEWKEVTLEGVSIIEKGSQINRAELKQKFVVGKDTLYPVYNGGINASGYTTDYNREADSIIISEGGNSSGYVNFVMEKFWSGGHSYTIYPTEDLVNKQYLFQVLKDNEKKIMALKVGSGLPNIQKTSLQKHKVFMPSSLMEQRKIANLLSTFDKKIEKENKKLIALNEQKQAFMQQIFV